MQVNKASLLRTGGSIRSAGASFRHSQTAERNCSIGRTINILSDAWAFLVIREAFFGARRFETFRSALGVPKATLSARLKRLTKQKIFQTLEYSDSTNRLEYRLTDAGLDLYPSLIALMQFGDRWLNTGRPPLVLIHKTCGKTCKPFVACSACESRLHPSDTSYRDGPGAGQSKPAVSQRSRRASGSSMFVRGRPSSVSLTLEMIGDRWTFLVLRDAFAGARTFEAFETGLGIATNILTDRLNRLVHAGVFEKSFRSGSSARFEYQLTAMGKDLFGPLVLFMAWGDRWLSSKKPPVILEHISCNRDFTPTLLCDQCHEPVSARTMTYRMNYETRKPAAEKRISKKSFME